MLYAGTSTPCTYAYFTHTSKILVFFFFKYIFFLLIPALELDMVNG